MRIKGLSKFWMILLPLVLVLGVAVACGDDDPTASSPSATGTSSAVVPTSPSVSVTEPEIEPAFAEYWQPPTDYYGDVVRGGTLRINYEDPLEHGNSWGAGSGVAYNLRAPVHNSIVQEDPYNEGIIIPDLARGWTFHDDGLGVTFVFHEGIQWHNGEPFTCEDARFSIATMATGNGLTASSMAAQLTAVDVDATECLNDLELSLRLNQVSATILVALSDRAAHIFNKAWFEAGGEEAMFNDMSVGTGPFMWEAGQSLGVDEQVYVRNPNYFKEGLPYVDKMILYGILDESAQQARHLAHQTDWHWVRNFGQYDAYVAHDQIETTIRPTRGHHSIWLNNNNPPLDNPEVRKAIFMGIDRDAGIRVLLDGHGSTGFMMAPGGWDLGESAGCGVPGWCTATDMDAQRQEAIAILEAEGFDFDQEFLFTVESDEQVTARATFVQEQLKLMGIKTKFEVVETVAYREKESQGKWGDILPRNDTMPADDPSLGMGYYFRCNSPNNHWTPTSDGVFECDDKMESLLDQASAVTDPTERKKVSDEIQLYAMEQYWKFPLYWEQEAVAYWPEVRGYAHHAHPSGSYRRFEHMWMDPDHADDKGASGQMYGSPGGISGP